MSKFSDFVPANFLEPVYFITSMDAPNQYCQDQYNKGLKIGNESTEISISVNDTWNANSKDGGYTTSYEKLGYHAHTAALLRGFLDSHCPIHIYRIDDSNERGHYIIAWDGTKHVVNIWPIGIKLED